MPQTTKKFWKAESSRSSSTLQPDIYIEGKEKVVLDTKWKNIGYGNPSAEDLRQMYAYHKFYEAKKVALVYPGTIVVRNGKYFVEGSEEPSDNECSIITIPTEKTIASWQESIANQVFEHWPNLINTQ